MTGHNLSPAAQAPVLVAPLTLAEFATRMAALGWSGSVLALAVSGGPDSMALALCAQAWAETQGVKLVAFTVDHALRPESAAEARQVQHWLQAHGLEHHILHWEHPPILQAIQHQARTARYGLLASACQAYNINHLALGHQLEDQAETVLLRFAKGSGIDGLGAMRPVTPHDGIILLRPLLDVPKARLIATCDAAGQAFITDPSNQKPQFARGRLRSAADVLAAEGLTPERLADLAERAALASTALDFYADQLQAAVVQFYPAGYAELELPTFHAAPEETRLRVLGRVLDRVGCKAVPLRHAPLRELDQALQLQSYLAQRTLHGCAIRAVDGLCRVVRELAATPAPIPLAPGETMVWDGRFQLTLATDAPTGLTVAALGLPEHKQLDAVAPGLRQNLPLGQARAALPALWQGETLFAVPDFTGGKGIVLCRSLLG